MNAKSINPIISVKLPYGKSFIELTLPKNNLLEVATIKPVRKVFNLRRAVANALTKPIGLADKNNFRDFLRERRPKRIAVIVEDATRPNHKDYQDILEELLGALEQGGYFNDRVFLVIAYGTHKKHKLTESQAIFGKKLMRSYRFHDHDCSSDNVLLGKMSTGTDLWVNEAIAHADYIISTGNIAPHTFAGFSGGRKGILPGVCGKDTIDANHAKVCRPGVGMGMLENNPIHLEMEEAAEKVGLQFIVNVVRNDKKEVVQVVAGDWKEAFAVGVAKAREVYGYEFKHRSDVVIASSGGFPKDTSLYHAQLAFTAMSGIVNKNGTLVLVAECANGAGQKVFAKTMAGNTVDNILLKKETEIPVGVHRAYLSAKILKDIECILVSSMEKKVVESMHFRYAKTIDDALSMVRKKHGDNYAAYVVPNGSYILPIIK